MKKQIAAILSGVLVCSTFLTGCGKNEATEAVKESVETEKEGTGDLDTESSQEQKSEKQDNESSQAEDSLTDDTQDSQASRENLDKVGVLLPEEGEDINSSLERAELKSRLEEAGYNPALYFAGNDSDTQISQIQELLQDEKLKALVISPVDPYSLTDVLEQVEEQSIPVIDYDDLIMDTANVKYFVAFNTRAIGKEIADNIVKKAELDKVREDRGVRTIEFLMGAPDDDASLFLFNGIMEGLQDYIDDGTLICRSGKTTFEETAIAEGDTSTAKKQLESVIDEYYHQEKTPDIICTAEDAFALAAMDIVEAKQIQPGDETWPLITGVNAEAEAVKSIAEGKLGFTVMMDRRDLAEACVTLVDTYLKGDDVEISNYSQYDNGVKIIGTATCDGKLIDKDNYQILVDNGFYLAEMIAPDVSPTPTPEEAGPAPEASVTPRASLTPEPGAIGNTADVTPKENPEITTEEVPSVENGGNEESSTDALAVGKTK